MSRRPRWLEAAGEKWTHRGAARPAFARVPGPGQESVWDYPRPPAIERDAREVVIALAGHTIARTRRALRVLETASPPTFYLPLEDITPGALAPGEGSSLCEWKGEARYFDVHAAGERVPRAAWTYPDPFEAFAALRDHVAFYPAPFDCTLGGAAVTPQPGRFYAGWVTPELTGPFKGEPGSEGW